LVDAVDVAPFIELSYSANDTLTLSAYTRMPRKYLTVPAVHLTVEVQLRGGTETFEGLLILVNRTFMCERLPSWRLIPLFIPKNVTLGCSLRIYRDSLFRAVNYTVVRLSGHEFECVALSNGSDTLIYDRFSGLLVKGLLRVGRHRLSVSLQRTNIALRRDEFSLYTDWYELTSYLRLVNASLPGLVRVRSIGRSVLGRDIWVVELNYIGRRTVLIDAAIHGSELVSAEAALYLVKRFAGRYLRDAYFRAYVLGGDLCISVIPMLNPDGVELGKVLPRETYAASRLNARYVDLNRNFPFMWSMHDSAEFWYLTYRGPYPASEPEVRAFISYYLSREVVLYISLHSGAPWKLVLAPTWDPELREELESVVEVFSSVGGYNISPVGYYGSSICWVYAGSPRRAVSLIAEVYSGEGESFAKYNPSNAEEVRSVCQEFETILLSLLSLYALKEKRPPSPALALLAVSALAALALARKEAEP